MTMGCGSSRSSETKMHYQEKSEPDTSVSSVEHLRTAPEGQENERSNNEIRRPGERQKPHMEWWAHPPVDESQKKSQDRKQFSKKTQPAKQLGHTVTDKRRKSSNKDSKPDRHLLMEPEDM